MRGLERSEQGQVGQTKQGQVGQTKLALPELGAGCYLALELKTWNRARVDRRQGGTNERRGGAC